MRWQLNPIIVPESPTIPPRHLLCTQRLHSSVLSYTHTNVSSNGSAFPRLHPVTGGYCVCRWLSIVPGVSSVPVWLLSPHLHWQTAWPSFYPHRLSISCKILSNYAAGDASWVGRPLLKDQSDIPLTTVNAWKAINRIVFFNDESSFLSSALLTCLCH